MLLAGGVCVGVGLIPMALATRTLLAPGGADPGQLVRRAVAPAQLAVGVILAAGGVVVVAGSPRAALPVLILSVTAALSTLVAGSWRGARYLARNRAGPPPVRAGCCGGACGCR